MRLARVEAVASPVRKTEGLAGHRVVIVSTLGEPHSHLVAAADPLQASVGDVVLITEGPAAGAVAVPASPSSAQVDAAVVAILRPEETKPGLFDGGGL